MKTSIIVALGCRNYSRQETIYGNMVHTYIIGKEGKSKYEFYKNNDSKLQHLRLRLPAKIAQPKYLITVSEQNSLF